MKFAIETSNGHRPAAEFSERLNNIIATVGSRVVDNDERPDIVVSVGGDGTMLAAAHRAHSWDVPVVGFNLGTMGFLAQAEPEHAAEVVDRLVSDRYSVEERMTVTASIGNRAMTGVNDVVVEKVDTTRLVVLKVTIDGERFTTYRADGLIVSTPTGSTAYSFSAGGPLVDPRIDALVVTPVAAHSLFDRALVLPGDAVFEITVLTDREVRTNVDKESLGELSEGDALTVRKGDRPVRFITLRPDGFPGVVRDKFGLD